MIKFTASVITTLLVVVAVHAVCIALKSTVGIELNPDRVLIYGLVSFALATHAY